MSWVTLSRVVCKGCTGTKKQVTARTCKVHNISTPKRYHICALHAIRVCPRDVPSHKRCVVCSWLLCSSTEGSAGAGKQHAAASETKWVVTAKGAGPLGCAGQGWAGQQCSTNASTDAGVQLDKASRLQATIQSSEKNISTTQGGGCGRHSAQQASWPPC